MRDVAAVAGHVDDLQRRLESALNPAQRLPLLLEAVDVISATDAHRALDHAVEAAASSCSGSP